MRAFLIGVVGIVVAAGLGAQERPEATSLLGRPLFSPPGGGAATAELERKLALARRAFERTPEEADSIIWLGRRTAYLGRYRDAIAIFSRGIALHPRDARLYRHRGHRYLTVRLIDSAIADLETAARLIRGTADQVEPDGLPNARNIPTSTLHSNVRYHLGLAYYLRGDFERARRWFGEDVARRANDDMLVASSHWLYMALRRLGRDREAARVLEPIGPGLDVIENQSYHRLLRLYRGELRVDSLLPRTTDGGTVEDVTTLYGVGNYHWYNGRHDEALRIFRRILETPAWAAFGYLAAEAELARAR